MGYTVGTLYHLFGDLDNFILHINARTMEEWYKNFGSLQPVKPEARAHVMAEALALVLDSGDDLAHIAA